MTTEAPTAPAADAPVTTPAADPASPAAAPSAPAPPDFSPDLPDNWHTRLGDEFSAHGDTLSRFKNVGDLAKSYIHARQMKPAFPGPDAAPQDVETWRQLAGVPESPEGYALQKPEDFPEGLEWSDDRAKAFAELAHRHHVHPSFLQEALKLDASIQGDLLTKAKADFEAGREQAKEALIQEWGTKFDENCSKVRHLTGRLAESAGIEPAHAEQLANDPAFAKLMLKVHGHLAEDSTRTPAGLSDVRGPQQRANDIMAGKDPEWGEKYHAGDTQAMQLVARLLEEAAR